jgi:ATP-dependent DNA helicase RecQ
MTHLLWIQSNYLNLCVRQSVATSHCISDWGHDFRPDYRRIVRIIQFMPANMPILATTATANNRVVADIQSQIGSDMTTYRGELMRESLHLQNIPQLNKAQRLAWLLQTLPELEHTGFWGQCNEPG